MPFPEFLAGAFEEEGLLAEPASMCAIAPDGSILWVNSAWRRFAIENGAPDAADATSYFDAIPEPLRQGFVRAFDEALDTGTPYVLEYECSSPELFRTFRLRALPIARDGLLVEHSLVVSMIHPGPSHAPLESRYVDPNGFVLQCANCRRVRRPSNGAFDWIPAWVAKPPVMTSHGLCLPCAGFYYRIG